MANFNPGDRVRRLATEGSPGQEATLVGVDDNHYWFVKDHKPAWADQSIRTGTWHEGYFELVEPQFREGDKVIRKINVSAPGMKATLIEKLNVGGLRPQITCWRVRVEGKEGTEQWTDNNFQLLEEAMPKDLKMKVINLLLNATSDRDLHYQAFTDLAERGAFAPARTEQQMILILNAYAKENPRAFCKSGIDRFRAESNIPEPEHELATIVCTFELKVSGVDNRQGASDIGLVGELTRRLIDQQYNGVEIKRAQWTKYSVNGGDGVTNTRRER